MRETEREKEADKRRVGEILIGQETGREIAGQEERKRGRER